MCVTYARIGAGWTGDSLAAHSAVSSFFDMRAAWTKWVDDMLFTQSMLTPLGAMPTIVPCIFPNGLCRGDPRHPAGRRTPESFADVAWGSVLPLLGAYTARLTGDHRFLARVAVGASAYVSLFRIIYIYDIYIDIYMKILHTNVTYILCGAGKPAA